MITWLFIISWYICGVFSFIYWWTKEFDYTSEVLLVSLFVGLSGPVNLITGRFIHNDEGPKILIRKRTK